MGYSMETLLKMILSQLSQAYYFTTCILVLKFMNKGIFFEEIQDLHFPQKRGYFGTHLCKFGEKGLFLMSSVLPWKGGFIWAEKSLFNAKKGFILDWKVSILSWKRGRFELKSQCFEAKKGGIFKLENKDGYHFFPVIEGAGDIVLLSLLGHTPQTQLLD